MVTFKLYLGFQGLFLAYPLNDGYTNGIFFLFIYLSIFSVKSFCILMNSFYMLGYAQPDVQARFRKDLGPEV